MNTDGYLQALEMRLRWLQWMNDYGAAAWAIANNSESAITIYRECLRSGDTFYMNRHFCEMVEAARKTAPVDLEFSDTWLASPNGFMWLEVPFHICDNFTSKEGDVMDSRNTIVAAVGWHKANPGDKTAEGRTLNEGATQFMTFTDFRAYDPNANGFGFWSYFVLENGMKLQARMEQFEAKHADGAYKDLGNRSQNVLHEIRWIFTAFHLMQERIGKIGHQHLNRASRRRLEQQKQINVPPLVQVITLRRLDYEHKKPGASTPIDWQFQWIVAGHWRNQYYPSEDTHRPKWIPFHVKGPEDKPLKEPAARLYVAKR